MELTREESLRIIRALERNNVEIEYNLEYENLSLKAREYYETQKRLNSELANKIRRSVH